MRYRLILTTVLLIAGGCTRPLYQKRDLVLEHQALEIPAMHVASDYRVGDKRHLGFGTGFPVSHNRGIAAQHDLPQDVTTLLVEREKVDIEERSNVENKFDDWLTFSLPGETPVPRIDPNVDLPSGTRFVVVGFPDCGINTAIRETVVEDYVSCEKRVMRCKVVRKPSYVEEFPDDIVLARTRYRGIKKGYCGSPVAVCDPETGQCIVFGIYIGASTIDRFSETWLEGIFSWEALFIQRIPEHLMERK